MLVFGQQVFVHNNILLMARTSGYMHRFLSGNITKFVQRTLCLHNNCTAGVSQPSHWHSSWQAFN